MSGGDEGLVVTCCGVVGSLIAVTCQQICFFTRCGRGQDTGSQNRGCCDSCFSKGFNEDDFDEQQRKQMKENAAMRAASSAPPTPQPPMTTAS